MPNEKDVGSAPSDLKENPKAQFEYGRQSEKKLQITDPESHRLEDGNPDIGDVDMGVIEDGKPSKKDDNSPLTEP